MAKIVEDDARIRAAHVSSRVHEFMYERIGQVIFVKDLTTLGFTKHQILRAISYLNTRDSGTRIEIVTHGNSYRMVPVAGAKAESQPKAPAKPNKRMFEEIGVAAAGIVIQDEAGKLYLAKEM